jgi:hypothetical protein
MMIDYLFPRFLDDPAEYAKAEAYWQRLWENLVPLTGAREWRSPWLQTAFADGTPFRDGDPIFSAWFPSRKCGIRIIQNRPQGEDPALDFWPDTVGDEWSGEVSTLVISCVLSRQTAELARELISSWIRYGEASVFSPSQGPPVVTQPSEFVFRVPQSERRPTPAEQAVPVGERWGDAA